MKKWKTILLISFLAFPASSTYKLDGYTFGGGGNQGSTSPNYGMQGRLGQINGRLDGNNFDLGAGLAFERQAGVPLSPTVYNDGTYSNKLLVTVRPNGNPTDTKFAIAASTDNFATYKYVRAADNTLGTTMTISDYQTYAQWGGASGFFAVGLDVGTSYSFKVRAMQGRFSETQWGSVASESTVATNLDFDIDVSTTDSDTSPPFTIDMGDLIPGSVVSSTSRVWIDFSTNAPGGGSVHIYGSNSGLYSTNTAYNIGTTSANLDILDHGTGIQGVGATQSSGGPMMINSPYNGTSNVVGKADSSIANIFSSSGPVEGGRASFVVKAKVGNNTPSSNDYSEILTVISSGNF